MKHLRGLSKRGESGQVLALAAALMVVLMLGIGLAVDLGYAYVTKANLSKALDAAALAGARNIPQGQTAAGNIAKSVFAANYQSSGRDVSQPTASVTWTTNPTTGYSQINVSATTNINTFFARVLPQFQTLTVGSSAQSTRANVQMTLVLDRSGSMKKNDGYLALPIAVQTFLTYFSDSLDEVALASFASDATLDVGLKHTFTSAINAAVSGFDYTGGTYAQGGLLLAQAQESVNLPNTLKVVVYFTDGWANTNLDTLSCSPNPINYGGCAPPEQAVNWCSGISFWFPSNPYPNNPPSCNSTSFRAQQPGNSGALTPTSTGQANIANDAMYRAIQLANTMRANNVVFYSIGLGDKISTTFLQQIANDPASPTFDSSKPQGMAVFATSCPGTSCVSDLQQKFQTVATDILLRLSQ